MPSTDPPSSQSEKPLHRRRVLQTCASAIIAGLAGCSGRTDDSTTRQTDQPATTPANTPQTTDKPQPESRPPLNGPWPTAHADPANTGSVDAAGPKGSPTVHWQEHVFLRTNLRVSTGPQGVVATRQDGSVLAYTHDGSLRWSDFLSGGFAAAPVVAADGTIVVGSRDGTVVAYDSDGTRRWQRSTPEGLFASHVNDATPFRIAGESDTVVLAHPRGKIYAFGLADGTEQWRTKSARRTHRPAIGDSTVFLTSSNPAGSDSEFVRAVSLTDGTEQWRTQSTGSLSIGPGFHQGVVYTATTDGRLVARSSTDGAAQWRVRIDDDPWISTIPVVFGGRVWVGTLKNGFYGVTADGVQAHVALKTATTPAVGDDRLYVGTTEFGTPSGDRTGSVLALDADGTELWRTKTRGYPESQVRYQNGHVTVGTSSGVVDQLSVADGSRRWRAFARPTRLPAPVVGPKAVYCGSRSDGVTGYRVRDGIVAWHVGFDGMASRTPAVAGQTVLAGSNAGDIAGTPLIEYAEKPAGRVTQTPTPDGEKTTTHIDAPAPEPRWRTTLEGPLGDIGYGERSAYLGSGTTLTSITAGGAVQWETDVGAPVREAPAVGASVVYATTTNGTLLAVDASSGTEHWRQSLGETATAPVLTESHSNSERLLVVGTDTGVVALTAANGTERWRTKTGSVRGTPAVTKRLVVVGDRSGVIRGLAISDGREQWQTTTNGPIHGSPAIGGDTAYVGSRDSHLYAVSTGDGAVNWRVELDDWVDGSPAIAYGAVFVVDQSGSLSAIVGEQ